MTFDEWRARYDTLTFQEHQQANSEWAVMFPDQRSFSSSHVRRFLEERQPEHVLELGGWDGNLAALMLYEFPWIRSWVNHDITPNVPQVCTDPRYERVILDDWPWNRHAHGDALICSHVLEHMKAAEVFALLTRWQVDSVYVDAPVNGGHWNGYAGSHILEVTELGLRMLLADAGFEESWWEPGLIGAFDREPVCV